MEIGELLTSFLYPAPEKSLHVWVPLLAIQQHHVELEFETSMARYDGSKILWTNQNTQASQVHTLCSNKVRVKLPMPDGHAQLGNGRSVHSY